MNNATQQSPSCCDTHDGSGCENTLPRLASRWQWPPLSPGLPRRAGGPAGQGGAAHRGAGTAESPWPQRGKEGALRWMRGTVPKGRGMLSPGAGECCHHRQGSPALVDEGLWCPRLRGHGPHGQGSLAPRGKGSDPMGECHTLHGWGLLGGLQVAPSPPGSWTEQDGSTAGLSPRGSPRGRQGHGQRQGQGHSCRHLRPPPALPLPGTLLPALGERERAPGTAPHSEGHLQPLQHGPPPCRGPVPSGGDQLLTAAPAQDFR